MALLERLFETKWPECGIEVWVEVGRPGQPVADHHGPICAVAVEHQVGVELLESGSVDGPSELLELNAPVLALAAADHTFGCYVQ